MTTRKNISVLILGANSDVAKECILLYTAKGYNIMAASRSTEQLEDFVKRYNLTRQVYVLYFDATDFDSHREFYEQLPSKPTIVLYAAGFLKDNEEALVDWHGSYQMMKVHYCGAVSILNLAATDPGNPHLKKIIGLSSLSGVRGRKSNFI